MPFFGFRWARLHPKSSPDGPRWQLSEADAFDMLCAQALMQEKFPQEVITRGIATGWYNRIRILGETHGWDVTITIKDKKGS